MTGCLAMTISEHTAWVADYFTPGPDGKRQRHSKTFSTKKEGPLGGCEIIYDRGAANRVEIRQPKGPRA